MHSIEVVVLQADCRVGEGLQLAPNNPCDLALKTVYAFICITLTVHDTVKMQQ